MAQTENGVGISWKLQDGTMIWARRDTWAELAEDVRIIKGDSYLTNLETALKGGGSPPSPQAVPPVSVSSPPPPEQEATLTPEAAAQQLGGGELAQETFVVCAACGALKDKWVPPGTSKRTGKAYKGFYGCPTRGCPGK